MYNCLECILIYAPGVKSRLHFQDKKYWQDNSLNVISPGYLNLMAFRMVVFVLILYIPVNIFTVMLGRVFLG